MAGARTSLAEHITALESTDEIARERACRALLSRAEAGERITPAIGALANVLRRGSVLSWIAACHALRAAATRGAKLGATQLLAVRIVAKPPKLADATLVRELRSAAAEVATHKWLTGNTWAISTALRDDPELRPGILTALREIAETTGKLARPLVGDVVQMLGVKDNLVAEEAARALRAFARANAKQRAVVDKALAAAGGAAAKRLARELSEGAAPAAKKAAR